MGLNKLDIDYSMLALQQAFPAKETKQSSIVCLQSCWIFGESFQFKYVRSIWPIFAFTDVTNCDGKAACFQKLMIAKPQASLPVLPVCKRRASWQTQLSLPSLTSPEATKVDRCRATPSKGLKAALLALCTQVEPHLLRK